MGKTWVPLESNPGVLTEFAAQLGLDAAAHSFSDVFGLDEARPALEGGTLEARVVVPSCAVGGAVVDDNPATAASTQELLAMVPQPVVAVIMCYPITAQSDAAAKQGEH